MVVLLYSGSKYKCSHVGLFGYSTAKNTKNVSLTGDSFVLADKSLDSYCEGAGGLVGSML